MPTTKLCRATSKLAVRAEHLVVLACLADPAAEFQQELRIIVWPGQLRRTDRWLPACSVPAVVKFRGPARRMPPECLLLPGSGMPGSVTPHRWLPPAPGRAPDQQPRDSSEDPEHRDQEQPGSLGETPELMPGRYRHVNQARYAETCRQEGKEDGGQRHGRSLAARRPSGWQIEPVIPGRPC